ncbi:MAG TPA: protein-(glutamine-N5) methyltransferase, release factor-specific, partial [Rudaea sp.]
MRAAANESEADAAFEAASLLTHVLGRPRAWLYAHADDPLDERDAEAFRALIARRASGEPVAYVTGSREFWSLD